MSHDNFSDAKVIVSEVYLAALANYQRTFPKLKEIHEGLVWTLAKDPLCGEELPFMPNHRVLLTYPASSHSEFRVVFKYDESSHTVYLLSIVSSGIIL